MKNHIRTAAAILLTALLATSAAAVASSHIYPETAMITQVDELGGTLTARTASGIVFRISAEAEDWMPGDLCSLIMYDRFTPLVTDDTAVCIQYSGRLSHFSEN